MALRRTVIVASRRLMWLALGWAAVLLLTGGFDTRLFGVPFTAHEPFRPLLVAAIALSVYFLSGGDPAVTRGTRAAAATVLAGWRRAMDAGERAAGWPLDRIAVALLAVAVLTAGVRFGSRGVSGSDTYGYLSQAALWLDGRIAVDQPWMAELPWPAPAQTAAPLGYRPAPDHWILTPPVPHHDRAPWQLVPMYAPGLPLLMALATRIAGASGAFWVVPVSAAILVLATYGIGRRIGSRGAGLIAAWLVGASQPVLGMTMSPMSDVPVAAAWAAAFWCALGTSIPAAAGAGLAGAVAILVRPNLAPLAALLVVPMLTRGVRRHLAHASVCLIGLATGALVTAATYWAMYGSPFESGYSGLDLFHVSNAPENLRLYTRWFAGSQTPIALAGLAALALPVRRLWPFVASRSIVAVFGLFVAGVWIQYLFYAVFDSDFYLRFLLATFPFIFLGLATALLAVTRIGPRDLRAVMIIVVAAFVAWLGVRGITRTEQSGAFTLRLGESKFVTAGVHVRPVTPDNSVVFAMQHSGSVRYYAGRVSLRWDLLDPAWLDRALAWLSARGVHPYALLDNWERDSCEQRFAGQAAATRFRRPPIFTFRDTSLYDLGPDPAATSPTLEIPESGAELGVVPPAPMPTLVLAPPGGR